MLYCCCTAVLSRLAQIAQRIVTMATINEKVILSYKNSIAGTPADMTTFEPAAYQYTLSTSNYNTLGLLKPASCKLLKYISAGLVDKCTGGYLLFGVYRALQFLWLCLCLQRLCLQRLALQRLDFFVGGGGPLPLAMGKGKHLGGGGGASSACNWEGKTWGGGPLLAMGKGKHWGGGASSACCMWFCTCSCICLCLCSLNTVLGLWHFLLWHNEMLYCTIPQHVIPFADRPVLCLCGCLLYLRGSEERIPHQGCHACPGWRLGQCHRHAATGRVETTGCYSDKQLDIFKRIGSLAEVQSEGKGPKMVLRLKKKIPQTAEAAAALAVALGQLNLKIGDFLSPDLLRGAAGGAVAGGEGAAGGGVDGGGAAADAGTDGGATAALAGGGGYGNLAAAPGSAAVAGGDGLGVFVDATL